MRASSEHEAGTRHMPGPAIEVRRAFWCEHTVSGADLKTKGRSECEIVSTPGEAIHKIRMNVRRLAPALPSFEQERAFNWTDNGGCLQAISVLQHGEPYAFSISSHGTWYEWTVRPFDQFLVPAELLLPHVPVHSVPCPRYTSH
ncbi:MAG TPA: hypothetical protein VIU15_47915 [Streptomyces sp.]